MLKVERRTLIVISGIIWLMIGIFLFLLGLNFLFKAKAINEAALIDTLARFVHSEKIGLILLIGLTLLVGSLKGRFVLGKSAKRQVKRILALPSPTALSKLYTPAYYLLLLAMIGLGMTMRFLPITFDVRGSIDMAIGTALFTGSYLIFRNLKGGAISV